jgi:hypothetical protein
LTLTQNLKASTPFGADVRKSILTPRSVTGSQILCTRSAAGEWRGVVHGSGDISAARVAAFRKIIGGRAKRRRWAMVVGDINRGVYVATDVSAVRNASVRQLCEANYPKVSNITCWWDRDGKVKVFPFDVTSSYHLLVLQVRTAKALALPGAAPPPAAKPPTPVAKPDPPATPAPATPAPAARAGKAVWPFAAKLPAGFRLTRQLTAEGQDVWLLEGDSVDGVRDVLLVVRTRPGAKPLLPVAGAIWAAGAATGFLPGDANLAPGRGGWARVSGKMEMRAGWRKVQTALGTGSPPSATVTLKGDRGQPPRKVRVSASECWLRDKGLVVAGGTRATEASYRAMGDKIDALAHALKTELAGGAKPPAAKPDPPKPKPGPKPKPDPSPEKLAQSQLRLARAYLDSGLTGRARDRLARIIKNYPNTKSAATAAELLKTLNKPK